MAEKILRFWGFIHIGQVLNMRSGEATGGAPE
jgi:hypothetical protein